MASGPDWDFGKDCQAWENKSYGLGFHGPPGIGMRVHMEAPQAVAQA